MKNLLLGMYFKLEKEKRKRKILYNHFRILCPIQFGKVLIYVTTIELLYSLSLS